MSFPYEPKWEVPLRVRDLAAVLGTTVVEPGTADETACRIEAPPTPLRLYFMLTDNADNVLGPASLWQFTGIDVTPPHSPTDLSISDSTLTWQPPADEDLNQHVVYCAAADDDASACPDAAPASVCARTGPESTYKLDSSAHRVAVAVAAVDRTGNVGAPSSTLCVTLPEEHSEERYTLDGRGCGCALAQPREPGLPNIVTSVASYVILRRRRGQRRRRPVAAEQMRLNCPEETE